MLINIGITPSGVKTNDKGFLKKTDLVYNFFFNLLKVTYLSLRKHAGIMVPGKEVWGMYYWEDSTIFYFSTLWKR